MMSATVAERQAGTSGSERDDPDPGKGETQRTRWGQLRPSRHPQRGAKSDRRSEGPTPRQRCWSSTTSGSCRSAGTEGAALVFHVVNTRYEKGHPTLVTTNRGLPAWGQIFGDAVVAAAILDRLMHLMASA